MILVSDIELDFMTTLFSMGIVDFDHLLKCVRGNTEYNFGDEEF